MRIAANRLSRSGISAVAMKKLYDEETRANDEDDGNNSCIDLYDIYYCNTGI